MPRGKELKAPLLEDLPESLRLSMIKLMSSFNISDLNEAYNQASLILDSNSNLFKEEINREAEKRYRSRHISELNKARETIHQNGYNIGYSAGFRQGENMYRIIFYCSKCGGELVVTPNSECHKEIMKHLKQTGWSHQKCLQHQ